MKNIEIDEELYQYIVSNTQSIGESASSILRRLLNVDEATPTSTDNVVTQELPEGEAQSFAQENTESNNIGEKEAVLIDSESQTNVQVSIENPVIEKVEQIGSFYDYINKEELAVQRGAVGRFLLILAALYRVHANEFISVCDIRGRDRLYFATNEAVLNASGSSTKPRQIPDSPYWVITNSNTTRKKMMLTEVAIALGYSSDEAEEIRDLL